MPIFNRRALRQTLGQVYLRDCQVGTTTDTGTPAVNGQTGVRIVPLVDSRAADTTATGQDLYVRSVARALNASTFVFDGRIGSFNVGSGAFVVETAGTTIAPSTPYEIHSLLPPAEKDLCLTEAVKRLRVANWAAIDRVEGQTAYSLGGEVLDVLDVAVNPYPVGSSVGYAPNWWRFYPDPNAPRVLVDSALPLSSQLVYRAVTTPTLGAGDTATINLPDDDWLLSGAAAEAYWMLERRAPTQEVALYRANRKELAARFARLGTRYMPDTDRKPQLDGWW